jgi:short-subunit dehydrogenase
MNSLEDKVAIVTGASHGIGARLAEGLHAKGARLVLAARDAERLQQVAGATGATIVAGDLTHESSRSRLIETTLDRQGRIDILINNAGRGSYYSLAEAPAEEARALFDLNYFAPLELTRLALPHLERTRGSVVNVSSIAGQISLPWMPLYSSAKFALSSLTTSQRAEFAKAGIHVMGVYPGYIDTEFQAHAPGPRPPGYVARSRRFAISAERCAADIVRGLELRRNSVVTPRIGWVLVWASRLFPGIVEARLASLQ